MAASTLSIVLPEPFKTYVEAQVEDGLYPSATVLIQSLLEEQQQREAKALQQLLDRSLQGKEHSISREELASPSLMEIFRSKLASGS